MLLPKAQGLGAVVGLGVPLFPPFEANQQLQLLPLLKSFRNQRTNVLVKMHARVAGVVTGMAGAVIFIAGLTRLGFLDSVLSRPFLRGFISAVGFVIIVDQLIPELGLQGLASAVGGVSHASSVDKLRFLFGNINKSSGITSAVSGISFLIIMIFR